MKNLHTFESFLNEAKKLNEAFEVHYSDGVRAMQKFNDKNKAIAFMKDKIESNKNLKEIAVYNAGSGFHSTTDTDAVVSWWGEGSYLDNVSKKDSKLAAKKMNESIIDEAKTNLGLSTWEENKGVIGRFRLGSSVINLRSVVNLSRDPELKLCRIFGPQEIGFEDSTSRKNAMNFIQKSFDSDKLKINDYEFLNEAEKPAGLSKEETLEIAKKVAEAISKIDNKKCSVNMKTLEEDSFDLDYDGEEFDGGSYNIYSDGTVRNEAAKGAIYGKKDFSVDEFVKAIKKQKS